MSGGALDSQTTETQFVEGAALGQEASDLSKPAREVLVFRMSDIKL